MVFVPGLVTLFSPSAPPPPPPPPELIEYFWPPSEISQPLHIALVIIQITGVYLAFGRNQQNEHTEQLKADKLFTAAYLQENHKVNHKLLSLATLDDAVNSE